jgi:hypothetical protein
MRPGSGGGPIQNAKAQSAQKQSYGKGGMAGKNPPKRPGKSGDNPRSRKGSPLVAKRK